jgi:hypothetical protein
MIYMVGPPGIPGASMRHRSLAWGSRANLETRGFADGAPKGAEQKSYSGESKITLCQTDMAFWAYVN